MNEHPQLWAALSNKVDFLQTANWIPHNVADLLAVLRGTLQATYQCFATVDAPHAASMILRMAAYVYGYTAVNEGGCHFNLYQGDHSFGQWLLRLDDAMRQAEHACARDAKGDVVGYLMNIFGALLGCLLAYPPQEMLTS